MNRFARSLALVLWSLLIISLPWASVLVPIRTGVAAVAVTDGWTVVTPSADSLVVYVSPTGNDNNSGLTPALAKRTVAAGYGVLRSGFPDQLLLERGGTWAEAFNLWTKSGRSASEPMVVGTYGPDFVDRPTLNCPSNSNDAGLAIVSGRVDHLVVQGIKFHRVNTGGVGFYMVKRGSNITIEDCYFDNFGFGMVIQGENPTSVNPNDPGRIVNVTLRRNVIADCHPTGTEHSEGAYLEGLVNVTVEENIFDKNGWDATHAANIFNHNCYADDAIYQTDGHPGMVFDRNISMDASSHGVQVRPGGFVRDNLAIRNPIQFQIGSGGLDGGTDQNPIEGLWASVTDNVALDARDIVVSATPRGWGYELRWLINARNGGSSVLRNIAAGNTGGYRLSYYFEAVGAGIKNLTFDSNIAWNMRGSVYFDCPQNELANITFTNNKLRETTSSAPIIEHLGATATATTYAARSGNTLYSTASQGSWIDGGGSPSTLSLWGSAATSAGQNLPDPTRTLRQYLITIGKALTGDSDDQAFDKFRTAVRLQRRGAWDPALTATTINDYFRTGFGLPTLGGTQNTPPTASAGTAQNLPDTDRSGGEPVTLDASASSAVAPASITGYVWREGAATISSGAGAQQVAALAIGTHALTLTVTDSNSLTGTATVTHTVTPNAPTGMLASSVTQTGASLAVTAYPGASTYTWQWGTTTGYGSAITTSAATNPLAGLSASTLYHWRVRVDAPGVSGAFCGDQTFTTPAPVNSAPTARITPTSQSLTDATRTGSVSAGVSGTTSSDPEGQALTYAWRINGGGVASTASAPTLSIPVGANVVSLTVTDPGGLTGSASATVTGVPGTATTLAAGSITQTTATLTCDAYANAFGYKFEYGIGTFASSVTVALPTANLTNLTPGSSYQARVTVLAGSGGSVAGAASSSILFSTVPSTPNQAPTANAGPDQTGTDSDLDGLVTFSLDGSGSSDPEGLLTAYTWRRNGNVIASGVRPIVSVPLGIQTIDLVVTDAGGLTSPVDSLFLSAGPGVPIVATAVPGPGSVTISVQAITNVDHYVWSWGATSGHGSTRTTTTPTTTIVWPEGTTIHYAAAAQAGGLTGTATGDQTAVAGSNPVATAPVANAGPDQALSDDDLNGEVSVTLDASGSTDDGTITAYAWTEGSTAVASGVGPTFLASIGRHTYTLTVTDNDSLVSIPDTVQVDLSPGVPINPTGLSAVGGVTLSCGAMDKVTGYVFSWGTASGVYGTPREVTTPSLSLSGLTPGATIYWTVAARVGSGASALTGAACAEQATAVLSSPTNSPPVANAGADRYVTTDEMGNDVDVTLDGLGSLDRDGSIASYVWTSLEGPSPLTGGEPTATLPIGTFTYTLTVTDDRGATGTDSVQVFVLDGQTPSGPAAPTGVQLYRLHKGRSLRVDWTASVGATSYTVLWGTASGQYTSTAVTTGTKYTIGSLTNGRRYYVAVRANNSGGTSVPSSEKSGVPRRVLRDQLLPRRRRKNAGRGTGRRTSAKGIHA